MEKADFIKRLVALRVSKGASARVMRQSQAQIGAISAPICAFYHRSLGGFSIVSVQPCPLFSDSGSKLGQTRCARTHAVHGLYGLLSCLQRARWWR